MKNVVKVVIGIAVICFIAGSYHIGYHNGSTTTAANIFGLESAKEVKELGFRSDGNPLLLTNDGNVLTIGN